jgi:hypothetical protein
MTYGRPLEAKADVRVSTGAGVAVQTTDACQVHNTHSPRSHVNEKHHIRPLGRGGANTPENRIVVCATGHNNIHQLLDAMLAWATHHPEEKFPPVVLNRYSFRERELAREGFDRIQNNTHGGTDGR